MSYMELNSARILITGASGFVGRHLLAQCRLNYPQALVYGLFRHDYTQSIEQEGVHPIVGDVSSFQDMSRAVAIAQPDIVFHLAAQSSVARSWQDPVGTLRANAEGFLHLIEALCKEKLTSRVLISGSSEQYGEVSPAENPINEDQPFRPMNPYAVSKVAQDLYGYQYFVSHNMPVIRVRAFNHFGPGQAQKFVIPSFAQQIASMEAGKIEPVLAVGNLQAQRDFMPVEDVVAAYLALAERGHPGMAYNVGSGHAYSIGEIVHILCQHTHININIREDRTRFRPTDQCCSVADTTRLRAHTQWQPALEMDTAIERVLDYWRARV
jgi:GDP-4-dehydro-6-deoxy-D-mannose reductase